MATQRQSGSRTRAARAAFERALRLVPASGDVEDLVENVSSSRNRPVNLVPFELGRGEPTGLWIATEVADYVVYPSSASAAERTAIICHELAHILLGHSAADEVAGLDALVQVAAPHINPSVARQLLARDRYGADVEVEAERLGTQLAAGLASAAERARLAEDTISSRLR